MSGNFESERRTLNRNFEPSNFEPESRNLKNCEPELSYILAEHFNKCLKESCFPDCWKVSSVVPVFKNVGEKSTAKNYRPVSLLSVVSKVSEKLVNNRIGISGQIFGLISSFLSNRQLQVVLDISYNWIFL